MRTSGFAAVGAFLILATAPVASQITVAPAATPPPKVDYVVCWARIGGLRYVSDPVQMDINDFSWMQDAFEQAVLPKGAKPDDHACSHGKTAAEAAGYVAQLKTRYPETATEATGWRGPFKIRGKLHSPGK